MAKKQIKRIKQPTDSMMKHYEGLFSRNQSKWMRRSKLEQDHLGGEFIFEGQNHKLLGSISSNEVVITNLETGEYFIAHIDDVTACILTE